MAFVLAGASAHVACLPLDDLSSYSSAWERQALEAVNGLRPDASAASDAVADSGTSSGMTAPPDAASALGSPPDASDDAGGPDPEADSSADGGAPPSFDAGPLLLAAGSAP